MNQDITPLTRLMASAVYRGIGLFYRAAPRESTLRWLLHFNKYVGLASWMVVCEHFSADPERNDKLLHFTQEFIKANIGSEDTVLDVGAAIRDI